MKACTFFEHSECYGLEKSVLRNAIEDLIKQDVNEFLVGNLGHFDGMVFSCLQDLSKDYPEISYSVFYPGFLFGRTHRYVPTILLSLKFYDTLEAHLCAKSRDRIARRRLSREQCD